MCSQKCLVNSPQHFICILLKLLKLIGYKEEIKGRFSEKYSKTFSETIWRTKPIICVHVNDMSLYINCFSFGFSRIRTLDAMATYGNH